MLVDPLAGALPLLSGFVSFSDIFLDTEERSLTSYKKER
jgi:hypothetical protein